MAGKAMGKLVGNAAAMGAVAIGAARQWVLGEAAMEAAMASRAS
jgi:hypothetical protein